MNIAIDFGTFCTKIAFLNEKKESEIFIPDTLNINHFDVVSNQIHRQIKQALDLGGGNDSKTEKTIEIAMKNFNELLSYLNGNFSFVENIILSVPFNWFNNPHSKDIKRIVEIHNDLGFAQHLHIQSDPVCAAAYYVNLIKEPKDTNFLICDWSGNKFEASLCEVKKNSIRVLYNYCCEETGGSIFDQDCLDSIYNKLGVRPISPKTNDRLLKELENCRRGNPEGVNLFRVLNKEKAKDEDTKDIRIYDFIFEDIDYSVTYGDISNALEFLKIKVTGVINKIQDQCKRENWVIGQICLAGGFNQYPLAQDILIDALHNKIPNVSILGNNEDLSNVITKGAYLILNKKVNVTVPYNGTFGLVLEGTFNGEYKKQEIQILEMNKGEGGMYSPEFVNTENGRPFKIQISSENHSLPIYYQLENKEKRYTKIQIQNIKPGTYSVGFQIDRFNNAQIVLKSIEDEKEILFF